MLWTWVDWKITWGYNHFYLTFILYDFIVQLDSVNEWDQQVLNDLRKYEVFRKQLGDKYCEEKGKTLKRHDSTY